MSWKSHETKKWLRFYQASTALSSIDFSRGLFLVYLATLGFSDAQLGLLQAVLFWVSFSLDLPTGIFADRFGRKYSVLLGLTALTLAYATLASAHSFGLLLVGFALWGMAYAFNSGASGALMYDGMKESGWLDRHLRLLSRVRSLAMLSTCASILIGGFIYQWSPPAIFWLTGIAVFVSALLFLRIPEPALGPSERSKSLLRDISVFIREPRGKSFLVFLIGMGFVEMVHTPVFIFSQIYFHQLRLSEISLSFLLAGGYLSASVVQNFAHRLTRFSLSQMIFGSCVVVAACLVGMAQVEILWLRILFFLVINTIPNALFVHSDQYIQDRVDSHIRASLLSIHSLTSTLMISFSYIAIGLLSGKLGLGATFMILPALLVLSVLITSLHFQMEKKNA